MLIQPVHKYWISSNTFIYRICCFKYSPTTLTLDWLYVLHFFLLNDCNIVVFCAVVLTTQDLLRDSPPLNIDIDDAHGHYSRCFNTLRIRTSAILRKLFVRFFVTSSANTCGKIFSPWKVLLEASLIQLTSRTLYRIIT